MAEARLDIVLVDDGSGPGPGQAGGGNTGDETDPRKKKKDGPSLASMFVPQGGVAGAVAGEIQGGMAMAAAGGPVGVAIGAVQATVGATAAILKSLGETARQAGEGLKALAANDYLGGFTVALDAAGKTLENIPIIGGALSANFGLLSSVVNAAHGVMASFVERGRQLADYSAPLSASQARGEVQSMLADYREAQELGPALAKLTDAWNDAWNSLREILLPIKKVIAETLGDWMSALALTLKEWEPYIRIAVANIGNLVEYASASVALWGGAERQRKAMAKILESAKEILEDIARRGQKPEDGFDRFLEEEMAEIIRRGGRPAQGGALPRPRLPAGGML